MRQGRTGSVWEWTNACEWRYDASGFSFSRLVVLRVRPGRRRIHRTGDLSWLWVVGLWHSCLGWGVLRACAFQQKPRRERDSLRRVSSTRNGEIKPPGRATDSHSAELIELGWDWGRKSAPAVQCIASGHAATCRFVAFSAVGCGRARGCCFARRCAKGRTDQRNAKQRAHAIAQWLRAASIATLRSTVKCPLAQQITAIGWDWD